MSPSPIPPFIDTQDYFNPGNFLINTGDILSNVANFSKGSYSLGMTPNIPLFFSCSIAYSASGGNAVVADILRTTNYSFWYLPFCK